MSKKHHTIIVPHTAAGTGTILALIQSQLPPMDDSAVVMRLQLHFGLKEKRRDISTWAPSFRSFWVLLLGTKKGLVQYWVGTLKLANGKQLYYGILWNKQACHCKRLVLATDRLVNVIISVWQHRKDHDWDTPVSVYPNNGKETVESGCLFSQSFTCLHSVLVVDWSPMWCLSWHSKESASRQ